jgi:hypothetical protein
VKLKSKGGSSSQLPKPDLFSGGKPALPDGAKASVSSGGKPLVPGGKPTIATTKPTLPGKKPSFSGLKPTLPAGGKPVMLAAKPATIAATKSVAKAEPAEEPLPADPTEDGASGGSGGSVSNWDAARVVMWAKENNLKFDFQVLEDEQINGMTLIELEDADLTELGVTSGLQRKKIIAAVKALHCSEA